MFLPSLCLFRLTFPRSLGTIEQALVRLSVVNKLGSIYEHQQGALEELDSQGVAIDAALERRLAELAGVLLRTFLIEDNDTRCAFDSRARATSQRKWS